MPSQLLINFADTFSPAKALCMPIDTDSFPPFDYRLCQHLEDFLRVFPAYASVCDADAVLQTGFTFGGDFLCACERGQ